jgi:hypothetical protein
VAIGSGVIVLGLVAGCSSPKQSADTGSAPAPASAGAPSAVESSGASERSPAGDASSAGVAAPPGGETTSFAVDAANAPPAALGRSVVSTANVTVRTDDIAAAREQAAAAVEAAGGYVYAEQGQFGDRPSVTVTLKVPPERFRSVLAALGKLGTVASQDVSTDDVTEQVIDLDSRMASAEVSVGRVRGFLDRATNVLEISTFESELLRRETDLEKLRGQKRALDGRVDLATIVLTVQPPTAVVATAAEPSHRPGFIDGLAAGWRAFVNTLTVVLVVLGALLPFVPIVAAVLAGAWWWRRRTHPAEGAA